MAGSEVTVKINGDATGLKKALDDSDKSTTAFASGLKAIAGAVSFGAIVNQVEGVVEKFSEAEEASARLTLSLQNQGIYSKALQDQYEDTAKALQAKTGVDDDAIVKGQSLLQSFVGQREVSAELTKAVVDLASATGKDLNEAFNLVGRTIGSNTNALARSGIEIDEHATKQEKIQQIIEKVNGKWKDQAEVLGGTLAGQMKITNALFTDLQEDLGKKFVPIVEIVNKTFRALITFVSDHDWILTLIRDVTLVAAAISGLVTVIYAVKTAFTLLAGATGVGLVVVAITLLAAHWSDAMKYIESITQAFTENISTILGGLGTLFDGIFHFDTDKIAEGFEQLKTGFVEGWEDFKATKDELYATEDEEEQAREDAKDQSRTDRNNKNYIEKTQYETDVAQAVKGIQDQRYQEEVKNDARRIDDEKKFGVAYAAINRAMHSEVYLGTKTAFGELAALQESSNSTLKGIGKAAAVANIVIKTAESAMNIFAGFSTIPIIGYALGTAGAAAAIAFGAEQIGRVTAAADGGLLTGGFPGRDSVPVMGMAGELISPRQNFEEVIGSVRAAREAKEQGLLPGEGGGSQVHVTINGDILADDSYIDRLVSKITDRVEFGNARLLASEGI